MPIDLGDDVDDGGEDEKENDDDDYNQQLQSPSCARQYFLFNLRHRRLPFRRCEHSHHDRCPHS